MLSSLKAIFGREQVKHYGDELKNPPKADSAVECGEDEEYGFTVIEATSQNSMLVKNGQNSMFMRTDPHERVETIAHCSSSAPVTREVCDDDLPVTTSFPTSYRSHPTGTSRLNSSHPNAFRQDSCEYSNFMKVSDVPVRLPRYITVAMEAKRQASQWLVTDHVELDISQFTYDFLLEKQFLASVQ